MSVTVYRGFVVGTAGKLVNHPPRTPQLRATPFPTTPSEQTDFGREVDAHISLRVRYGYLLLRNATRHAGYRGHGCPRVRRCGSLAA